jgi:hypothetical protein
MIFPSWSLFLPDSFLFEIGRTIHSYVSTEGSGCQGRVSLHCRRTCHGHLPYDEVVLPLPLPIRNSLLSGMPTPLLPHIILHHFRWASMGLFRLLQNAQHGLLVDPVREPITNCPRLFPLRPFRERIDLQAAIAIHAVNIPGGVH